VKPCSLFAVLVMASAAAWAQQDLSCPSSNTCSVGSGAYAYTLTNTNAAGLGLKVENQSCGATLFLHQNYASACGNPAVTITAKGPGIELTSDNHLALYASGGTGPGVFGYSTDDYGVAGTSTDSYGVTGSSSTNYAVYGVSSSSTGVHGVGGSSGNGAAGINSNASVSGVYAQNNTANGYGVAGRNTASTGSGAAVYGDANNNGSGSYGGYFNGRAHVVGALSKGSGSFLIDHPLDPTNKYLVHSFVESPDMKNIYDGVAVLDSKGRAKVQMPTWFEALNMEFRYQLTCIGGFAPVYVSQEIENNSFSIAGGSPGLKVSWQVTGTRNDAFAAKFRLPVEYDKPVGERGQYLHPEAFGLPKEMGMAGRPITPMPLGREQQEAFRRTTIRNEIRAPAEVTLTERAGRSVGVGRTSLPDGRRQQPTSK